MVLNHWNTSFFLVLVTCLFTVSGQETSTAKEKTAEINITKDEINQESGLASAVRNGDIEYLLECLKNGSFEQYIEGADAKSIEVIMKGVKRTLMILRVILFTEIATISSDTSHLNSSGDQGLFKVSLVKRTDLEMKLQVNLNAIERWNSELYYGLKPLSIFCALPDLEPRIAKYILDNSGLDINDRASSDNTTALYNAAASGNLALVKFLVENGATVNDVYKKPMDYRYERKYLSFVKIFSRKEMKIPPGSMLHTSAMQIAASKGYTQVVKYLLSVGADVNVGGQAWAALFPVFIKGYVETAQLLIEYGIDVNAKDFHGMTSLHLAADLGDKTLSRLLIRNSLTQFTADKYGWTPVHVAAFMCRSDVLESLLLSREDGVDAPTELGFTPLILVEAGLNEMFLRYLFRNLSFNTIDGQSSLVEREYGDEHMAVISLLLDRGAAVDQQDDVLGWTALHWAAGIGDIKAVRLMVERYGATVNVRSRSDVTPAQLAKYLDMKTVADYLQTNMNILFY